MVQSFEVITIYDDKIGEKVGWLLLSYLSA